MAAPPPRNAAKLTAEQVTELRRQYAEEKIRQVDLAEQFGISQAQVSRLVNRQQWVTDD